MQNVQQVVACTKYATGCGICNRLWHLQQVVHKIIVFPFAAGCGPNEVPCESEGGVCFSLDYICDGIPDCISDLGFPLVALDELNCSGTIYCCGIIRCFIAKRSVCS